LLIRTAAVSSLLLTCCKHSDVLQSVLNCQIMLLRLALASQKFKSDYGKRMFVHSNHYWTQAVLLCCSSTVDKRKEKEMPVGMA
jgi:hypothetical protein